MTPVTLDNTQSTTAQPRINLLPGGQADPKWQAAFDKASAGVQTVVDKFIASALVNPLVQQMQNDPFKSDLFHGGYGEDVFAQQLNAHMSDEIVASGKLDVSSVLAGKYRQWLEHQPTSVLERTAQRSVDLAG